MLFIGKASRLIKFKSIQEHVPKAETVPFLEESLSILGLNEKEANEFIIYWLPILEQNEFNIVHFSSSEYEKYAKLEISPEPETLIRVMMVFQGTNEPVQIKPQDLQILSKERKGLTVVEWGGQKIPNNQSL